MRPKAIFNWSTGKDSALALHEVLRSGEYDVAWLLTTVNDRYDRVSMHGVRRELLEAQAASIGIPLVQVRMPEMPTMEAYESAMREALGRLRGEGAVVSIFGDIFLEDLRAYRERRLAEVGLEGVFPLWQRPTGALAREVVSLGFKAVTTCVNDAVLDRRFVGRVIDDAFLRDLPPGVDPCGENGEFHTFVFDGPVFRQAVPVHVGAVVHRTYEAPGTAGSDGGSAGQGAHRGVGGGEEDGRTPQSSYEYRTSAGDRSAPATTGFWYCDLTPRA